MKMFIQEAHISINTVNALAKNKRGSLILSRSHYRQHEMLAAQSQSEKRARYSECRTVSGAHSHLIGLHWSVLHVQIPDLHRQVVPGHHVAAVVAELDIGDRGDDLGEEGAIAGVFWLLKHWAKIKEDNVF